MDKGMMDKLGVLSNAIDTFELEVNREEVLLKDLISRIEIMTNRVEELRHASSILEEVARLFKNLVKESIVMFKLNLKLLYPMP